jgi:hypothetical protein
MLVASIALLGAVAWSRIGTHGGGWRSELEGMPVGELPVADLAWREVHVRHPALIYLFDIPCAACEAAADRLNEYAAARRPGALPIYALTNSTGFVRDSASRFHPGIQPLRLRRTTRELRFVKELPLLVRTDASGRIRSAYAGVPSASDLETLGYPWRASSTDGR